MRTFRCEPIADFYLLHATIKSPSYLDLRNYISGEQRAQTKLTVRMRFPSNEDYIALGNPSYWKTIFEKSNG